MSKDVLKSACETAKSNYSWSLYFIKVDKRGKQPYTAYKVRFKNTTYLGTYASSLISATMKYQIETLSNVQEYDGENSKVSCDKITLTNELIKPQWDDFCNAIGVASDSKIDGGINAYVLDGQPQNDEDKPILFVKVANPITKLTNKKSVVFKTTAENELDLISDDVCRLYLTVDFLSYENTLYTFNHTFESLFSIEKTMTKVKAEAINTITATDVFSDSSTFESLAKQYKSSHTFITLKSERITRIKNKANRKKIASMLKLPLDQNGNLNITTPEQTLLLIRYLCFKILQDEETKDIFEASGINKLDI